MIVSVSETSPVSLSTHRSHRLVMAGRSEEGGEQMIEIAIDGYLLQGKLADALRTIVGSDSWKGSEIPVPGTRRRWDMGYEIGGVRTVVEFDGDAHYRDSLKIKTDIEKDDLARKSQISVVRFPYWVQLTKETLLHYFGLRANVRQDFPHGFITTKIFPASFCSLGIERFRKEFESLPDSVQNAVANSLRDRAKEYGACYVVPNELRHILTTT